MQGCMGCKGASAVRLQGASVQGSQCGGCKGVGGHKGVRVQGCKGARLQGCKGVRVEGRKGVKAAWGKCARVGQGW